MQTKKLMLMGLIVLCSSCHLLKRSPKEKTIASTATAAVKPAKDADKELKTYKEVITEKAKTKVGFFKVHQLDNRYFLEIPDSLLQREILLVNRIQKAPAASGMYGGDEIDNAVIAIERGKNHKLFIKKLSYKVRSSDSTENGMRKSVLNSDIQPLVAAFDIKTYARDTISNNTVKSDTTKKEQKGKILSSVIDVTDYLNGDENIFGFDKASKKSFKLSSILAGQSYIGAIRVFPKNVEFQTIKTYSKDDEVMTFAINSSWVLLPSQPMRPRRSDARVGYFTEGYIDFDGNPQGVKRQALVTRWRLEPKPEDRERYLRGELVEPQKQIVYYIDPATPKKWVPYLIQGINDWQVAFEQAGFKNAIVGKVAPTDSTWSLDDARNSAIVYKASPVANASGPHVADPRTGEILESHINWYHNVMELLQQWYFIQAGAVDPRARRMQYDDELMGQLIRFVSSHEVGHTLGLRHNFGSSATVPVEKLRDKQWVEANGHTPSIMDYARFNYVAQPEDHIGPAGIYPRIGEYDKWAIEWGYRWWPEFKTTAEEDAYSNRLIMQRLKQNKHLVFGTESDDFDPRNQSEALGDNAMLASHYGILNLKRILPNLLDWTRVPTEGYEHATEMHQALVGQYHRYIGHVTKNVGGTYTTPKAVEESGPVYEMVPKAIQQEAVRFLNKELFTTPNWLIDDKLTAYTGLDGKNSLSQIQEITVKRLLNWIIITRLIEAEAKYGVNTYTCKDLFADLTTGIWGELSTGKAIDISRRRLQQLYVTQMINLFEGKIVPLSNNIFEFMMKMAKGLDAPTEDPQALAYLQLQDLSKNIQRAIPKAQGTSKAHLQFMLLKIRNGLEKNAKGATGK
ncbi:hypothetical protein BWD42_07460 [Sphingobacterium sp. CZ-UAM]|uniref:zinc-dependent metalloprotease n=1 Tax=Sphingobacterium sp. CZ-UAM TaxID=1933868 RepID=UPI0009862FE1|nr:zinc-dependent metalloprotease [Sphingobacterium sp. CZ-UAM]OOG19731.1 hypothetical protein BWD42_07460 [Sphingobacterium sp. CZ-UAM]